MTAKHKPATPLPWTSPAIGRNDHPYMLHAANAYPKLVEALRQVLLFLPRDDATLGQYRNAAALLRELGEDA